ncbi:hypothetical protein pVco7_gp003 [Vibrio phage pVco-7]|uniref:Uncharacterized protein n=1 Tax=Vibrio phage pVco-5 TaxID=1965485 RepID=A0A1W6JUQ4_9CAUD|nr:antimicrobial peptide resistance and lipid A acylation protein PagP [Vibrio phage pVco-5]ARM70992.1 hypothetical protein pVco5_004 [Vibrio phage pVco-5]
MLLINGRMTLKDPKRLMGYYLNYRNNYYIVLEGTEILYCAKPIRGKYPVPPRATWEIFGQQRMDKKLLTRMLTLLGLLLISFKVCSADLILGGFSYHIADNNYCYAGECRPLNETNNAIGIQDRDIRLTLYKNSYYKDSFALMWVPSVPINQDMELGLRLGATTGYQYTPVGLKYTPIVGIEMKFDFHYFKLVPAFQAPSVLSIHMEIPLP